MVSRKALIYSIYLRCKWCHGCCGRSVWEWGWGDAKLNAFSGKGRGFKSLAGGKKRERKSSESDGWQACSAFIPSLTTVPRASWSRLNCETGSQTAEGAAPQPERTACCLPACPSVTSTPGPVLLPVALAGSLNFTCGSWIIQSERAAAETGSTESRSAALRDKDKKCISLLLWASANVCYVASLLFGSVMGEFFGR